MGRRSFIGRAGLACAIGTPRSARGSGSLTSWTSIATPDHRTVLCEVAVGAQRLQAMIDSGASRSALSTEAASKLGLSLGDELHGVGVTGTGRGRSAPSMQVLIAGRELRLENPTVYDLRAVSFALQRPIDVVLGADLFDRFAVRLDFLRSRLGLLDPEAATPTSGFNRVPMHRDQQGRLIITVRLGEEAVEAQIDLGSDVAVYLSPTFVRDQGLLQGKATSQAVSVGVEGAGVDTVFTLPRLTVGATNLDSLPVRSPRTWTANPPLLIGMPVLRRFELEFRVVGRALWLRPEPTLIAIPFRHDRSGLGAGWNGRELQIAFVAPRSPASVADLRIGDVIAAIDGRPVNAEMLAGGVRFGAGPAGTRLTLDLADGRRVVLTLADYF